MADSNKQSYHYIVDFKGNTFSIYSNKKRKPITVFNIYVEELLITKLSSTHVKEVMENKSDEFVHGFKIISNRNKMTILEREEIVDVGYFWNSVNYVDKILVEFSIVEEMEVTPEELPEMFEETELSKSKIIVDVEAYKRSLHGPVVEELKRKLQERKQ